MKYSLILADPPWLYDNQQQNDPARGGITYTPMDMKDICELPIADIAADDSVCVMWCTSPKFCDKHYEQYDPLTAMRMWGFRPVTFLFVWIKTNKNGEQVLEDANLEEYDDWYSGLGKYTNSNIEFAVIGRRGKALPRLEKNVKQLIFTPIGKHSAKPQEQYKRLERMFGDVPRIELFARKENPPPEGWRATGLDYDGMDIRDFITQEREKRLI